jgi:hypothetical protein
MKNIVLVHGGFVDGSGWEGVYKILKKDGHNVSIVQNPTISLKDDVAVTKRILAAQDGPANSCKCLISMEKSWFLCAAGSLEAVWLHAFRVNRERAQGPMRTRTSHVRQQE